MENDEKYITKNDSVFIKVDTAKIGREIDNLKLIIKIFRSQCENISIQMNQIDEDCDEYYELQDELNDCEMVISDSEDRYEDLVNIPKF